MSTYPYLPQPGVYRLTIRGRRPVWARLRSGAGAGLMSFDVLDDEGAILWRETKDAERRYVIMATPGDVARMAPAIMNLHYGQLEESPAP